MTAHALLPTLHDTVAAAPPSFAASLRAAAGAAVRRDADGAIIVVSSLTRDQLQNRADARDKLAALIRAGIARRGDA